MIVFAGPSLNDTSIKLCHEKKLTLLHPVKRGDILFQMKEKEVDSMLIADGIFHQHLSVGHEEILAAISTGWVVHGVSSMGAIRAYELRNEGMKGHGKVYQRFLESDDFQDDEVALLHLPAPYFTNMSEPLVHFRACIEHLASHKIISSEQAQKIISVLKLKYYGDRTMPFFLKVFEEMTGQKYSTLNIDFKQFKEKEQDLIEFLQLIPPAS